MAGRRPSLVELRVLEGANLYFPRAGGQADPRHHHAARARRRRRRGPSARAARPARRRGRARPAPGCGSASPMRVVATVVRRVAHEAGTTRLAVRSRPTADLHRLVVAYPWRHRGRAEALGHAVAGVLDALPGAPTSTSVLARRGRATCAAPASATPPTPRRPHVPVVAVTGTNGKTTTSRMVARMGRCAGLVVGWSSTDGVYVDGELVEAGRLLRPERRRPGAGRPAGAARRHRDRARRHPAARPRRRAQRRVGRHQRQRRPPRAAGRRHGRPARRGQGGHHPGHPAATAGSCSTATTRGPSRCGWRSTRGSACSPATPTRRRCARCSTRAAGRSPCSTARSPSSSRAPSPTRWWPSSTSR